ncbi:MAG TPA: hypothetical protein VNQ81_11715 [Povalibacter sp.]|nr:hypothetical protein [Povalibacter sp.]
MLSNARNVPHRPQSSSLRREIVAILCFKLLALLVLYFLFFDQRPEITPTRVEQQLLQAPDGSGAP